MVSIALLGARAAAQQDVRVPLEVTPGAVQDMYLGIAIQAGADGRLVAHLPGGGDALIDRIDTPVPGVVLHIAGGRPDTLVLVSGQVGEVRMKRTIGHQDQAAYLIGYQRSERDGKVRENLSWCPVYRAEGRLKLPGCEMNVVVLDLNGDGRFDARDSRQGTTIGLDVNNDGRIWGAAEWRKANEIIEICGRPLEVADLDPAGLSITLRESAVKPAVTGSVPPPFTVTTTEGRTIRSDDFRGQVLLLDFWASWCGPCVASLAHVDTIAREHSKDLAVIGINVDEPEQRAAAEKVLVEKRLSFSQVVRGLGETDYLWKMFGSMTDVRLTIPLYVVIDSAGIIRYAGHGGDDLADVEKVLRDLLKATRSSE